MSVPFVPKETVSIVVIGSTGHEPFALRTMLEAFNYRVEIHWVGSRAEAVEILKGNIPTFPHLILSCHGDEAEGGCILVPDEPPLTAHDLRDILHLPGKIVLNLGCATGTPAFAESFRAGRCAAYIAPTDYVQGNSALFFAVHLYYFLARQQTLEMAIAQARNHDEECGLFQCFLW
jgi:hypothetical protein